MVSQNRQLHLVVAGAQKAGTTSLFHYLSQHPDLCAHAQQEMTVFVNHKEYGSGYEQAFDKYFPDTNEQRLLLAKHVMLMNSDVGLKRLHHHNPEAHLVLVLRDPVDRAYSAYWYGRRMGWESHDSFESALEAEKAMRPDAQQEKSQIWYDRNYYDNGIYLSHIKRILNYYPRKQLHIWLYEDIVNRPTEICANLFEIAGLDTSFVPDTARRHNASAAPRSRLLARAFAKFLRSPVKRIIRPLIPNALSYRMRYGLIKMNETEFTPPPIEDGTRLELAQKYKDANQDLADFIQRDLDSWC